MRGIALSTPATKDEPDFSRLQPHIERVIGLLLPEKQFPLLNVNFPQKPRGLRWTRQSVRHYDGKVVPGRDPLGRPIFWFTVIPLEPAEEGTDRWAVDHGYISVTPLRLDLTDESQLASALTRRSTATHKTGETPVDKTQTSARPHSRRLAPPPPPPIRKSDMSLGGPAA